MNIRCLLVDDEPVALNVMEDHLKKIPGIEIVGRCYSAIDAFVVLQKEQVDVLFIDIQMPGMTGIDLIKSLKNLPAVVLTTAYTQYAIEGFELNVTDYLLKPVSFNRLLKTIEKIAQKNVVDDAVPNAVNSTSAKEFFFIKSDSDFVKLEYNKILFIEALENYVRIHSIDKNTIVFSTLKNIEDLLVAHNFLRIHKSYIVNINKVDAVLSNAVRINKTEIPMGSSFKQKAMEILRPYFL